MRFLAPVFLALCLLGCGSVNKQFVDAMDGAASKVLPDLKAVYRGEPLTLDAEQRARRLRLVEEWERTIAEAKEATR